MSEKGGKVGRFTVLFDGDCSFCSRSVEALRVRDLEGVLEFVPAQDPGIEKAFPGISREGLAASLHLVGPEGKIWVGAGAVEELARILPGFRWLRFLFGLPFARGLAGGIYGWIARNRFKFTCGSHCPPSGE